MSETLAVILSRYKDKQTAIMRMACATLASKVIYRTPVLSGSARKSWNPTIGEPVPNNVTIGAPTKMKDGKEVQTCATPDAAIKDFQAVANALKPGDFYSLCNGKPYIHRLEFEAWSAQAPQGMLRISVAEWQQIVDRSI